MKNTINLFEALQLENKPKINVPGVIYNLSVFFIIALTVTQIASGLIVRRQQDGIEQAYAEKLQTPVALDTLAENGRLDQEILSNEYGILVFDELDKRLAASPGFESPLFIDIAAVKPSSVTITAFSYSGGEIEISCTTEHGSPPADFVRALDRTGLFPEVSYKGFTGSSELDTVSFSIVCTLKGGDVDEPKG